MSLAIIAPGWIEEQRRHLATVAAQLPTQTSLVPRALEVLTVALDRFQAVLLTEEQDGALVSLWDLVCDSIRTFADLQKTAYRPSTRYSGWLWFSPQARQCVLAGNVILEQFTALARTILISRPELDLALPPDLEEVVWTVRISPLAYLRATANLFWSAIRHPLSETTIDLSTGRVLYRT